MMKTIKSKKYPGIFHYQDNNGKTMWMYRYRYTDERGKGREKKKTGFPNEKKAQQALLELQAAALRGENKQIEYSHYTVSQWFDIWYDTHKDDWKPTSRIQREMVIRLQIKPLLGNHKLKDLDKTTYKRKFINPLLKKYKVSTVKLFHTLFKIGINAAVDNEILPRNRFTKVTIRDNEEELHNTDSSIGENFLLADELNRLLSVAKEQENITNYTLLLLLAYTGLRRGEACGLQWKNINFEEKTLTVERTKDNKGARPPKTKNSYRTILIDDILLQQLREYQTWCKQIKLSFGKRWKKDDFILTSYQTAKPITDSTIIYALRRVIQKAEVKSITPHGLRHTHATLLISKNVSVKVIADRLGNTPQMILDIYGHTFKELEEESVQLFADSLNGQQTGKAEN